MPAKGIAFVKIGTNDQQQIHLWIQHRTVSRRRTRVAGITQAQRVVFRHQAFGCKSRDQRQVPVFTQGLDRFAQTATGHPLPGQQ